MVIERCLSLIYRFFSSSPYYFVFDAEIFLKHHDNKTDDDNRKERVQIGRNRSRAE